MLPTLSAFASENWIAIAGLASGAAAFIAGLLQYRRTQAWKRAEWVAREVAVFLDTPSIQKALTMIDWSKRKIELFPSEERHEDRFIEVTDQMVADALVHHSKKRKGFTKEEAAIRDIFDCLLDGLEKFNTFIDVGLISASDVQPYLDYWIERIGLLHADARDQERLQRLRTYIGHYDFVGANKLIERYQELKATGRPGTTS